MADVRPGPTPRRIIRSRRSDDPAGDDVTARAGEGAPATDNTATTHDTATTDDTGATHDTATTGDGAEAGDDTVGAGPPGAGDPPSPEGAPGSPPPGDDGEDPRWVPVARDGAVTVARPDTVDTVDAGAIEALPAKERRRRRRRARRDGRYLFRGRFLPRTLRGVAAVAVAMGLAAGAAAAATYAVMDARVARAQNDTAPAPEPTTPVGGLITPGPAGDPALSEILIDANATGADATIEGLAVAVSDDQDRTFWLTAYDLVAASTVVPPSPVTLRSSGDALEVWTWDEDQALGLVATADVEATPRTWIPAEITITSGSLLTVILPTDGPPLPVTVAVEEPLTGPRDTFTVRIAGTTLPLGAGVTAPDGRLVGIITAADYSDGGTVATVSAIRNACDAVLDCRDEG